MLQKITLVLAPAINIDSSSKSPVSWSIRSLFGIGLLSTCPLASTSSVIVENAEMKSINLDPSPSLSVNRASSKSAAIYNLVDIVNSNQNLKLSYANGEPTEALKKPIIKSTRYLGGYGQEEGDIVTKLENRSDEMISVVFMDILPWYLRVYFHTLRIEDQHGNNVKPHKSLFDLGVDEKKPYSMELVLSIPARSSLKIVLQFEKSILQWLEYPPDANHGFYVGSACISYIDETSCCNISSLTRLYTQTLLVSLPTPDFSMPYMVIMLTCTVIMFPFARLYDLTTKSLMIEQ